ncbi:exonuclease SbcC [Bifidobacterium gallicum DSM 20093 = LMG 11596]|uniref:Nuclease SbcCD subunit C n=1 Tax=Bifidobacterium gallicum DSM 20093 = LMG 11596 TaxID=561180 RepID=A0A087AFZ0_9BIFI|nr:exonuclease SbcC [Bifidobacterium gallicum DSM 20093 = LMG 11596]
MKLIGLCFEGIGPYASAFSLDLARLSRNHMFLIEGCTGSGKSMILDALVFALYGDVSSLNGGEEKARLRSRFLDHSRRETSVKLVFENNGDYYYVHRTPKYMVPKQSGTGATEHKPSGTLLKVAPHMRDAFESLVDRHMVADTDEHSADEYFEFCEHADNAEPLCVQVGAVGTMIEQIVGLNRQQFCQTVILPQGQFSRFLRLKPEERSSMVKDLFAAADYERIQHELRDMRLERGAQVATRRTRLESAIATARDAALRCLNSTDADLDAEAGAMDCAAAVVEAQAQSEAAARDAERDALARECVDNLLDSLLPAGDSTQVAPTDCDEFAADHGHSAQDAAADVIESPYEQSTPIGDNLADERAWCVDVDGALLEPAMDVAAIEHQLTHVAEQVNAHAEEQHDRTSGQLHERETQVAQAQHVHDQLQQITSVLQDIAQTVNEQHELAAQSPRMDQLRAWIERSNQAKPVSILHYQAIEAARLQHESGEELQAVDQQIATLTEPYGGIDGLHAAHDELNRIAQREPAIVAGLELVVEKERKLAAVAQTKARTEQLAADLQAAEDHYRSCVDDEQRIGALGNQVERIEHYEQLLEARGTRERELQDAQTLVSDWDETDRMREALLDAQARLHDAQSRRAQVRGRLDAALQDRLVVGLVQIADQLEPGQPCPVCGSLEHPKLAQMREASTAGGATEHVTNAEINYREELERLRAEHDEALAGESAQQIQVTRMQTRLDELTAAIAGRSREQAIQWRDEAQRAVNESNEARAHLAQARQIAKQIVEVREQVQHAKEKAETTAAMLDTEHQHYQAAQQAAQGLEPEALQAERSRLEQERHDALQAAGQLPGLQNTIERVSALHKERTLLATKLAERTAVSEHANAEFLRACKEAGFADGTSAAAAVLSDVDLDHYAGQLKEYDERRAALASQAHQLRTQLAILLSPESVSSLRLALPTALYISDEARETAILAAASASLQRATATLHEAQASRDAAIRDQQSAMECWEQCANANRTMLAEASQWAQAMHAYEPLRRMAELVTGGRDSGAERKTTLITYAVTERFRDVLARANDLLRDIRDGYYELRLGDQDNESADGTMSVNAPRMRANHKTGLPILIYDRRCDTCADPDTLSGGERFFVSLALALALADIIEGENGGVRMETLFIDEGFGSLSADVLDEVMDVLEEVGRSRTIGIISHVGSLVERIGDCIMVSREREDGPSTISVR